MPQMVARGRSGRCQPPRRLRGRPVPAPAVFTHMAQARRLAWSLWDTAARLVQAAQARLQLRRLRSAAVRLGTDGSPIFCGAVCLRLAFHIRGKLRPWLL